jgi:16S rRNA (cytosine967-C5)-methyltransferase
MIVTANNQHPPFALRVNVQKQTREEYLKKIVEQDAASIPETTAGIVLQTAVDVQELPGFAAGDISVQDGAAQLAAELLAPAPGDYVLDACAAPGGKACHILEMQPTVKLVAIDCEASRLALVRDNLQRLHLDATCLQADAGDVIAWWDGELFDRVLLDAPCSATGVIRRHPDIKLLRQPDDIANLAVTQLRLLTRLWTVLKPGGRLVYATCSIFPEENEEVVKTFLLAHPDAIAEPMTQQWGKRCAIGRQVLPGMHGMDGFYFACLSKRK